MKCGLCDYATLRTDMKMIFCSKIRGKSAGQSTKIKGSYLSSIIFYISFAQVYAPLFHQTQFTNPNSDIKIIKDFKTQHEGLQFQTQGPVLHHHCILVLSSNSDSIVDRLLVWLWKIISLSISCVFHSYNLFTRNFKNYSGSK